MDTTLQNLVNLFGGSAGMDLSLPTAGDTEQPIAKSVQPPSAAPQNSPLANAQALSAQIKQEDMASQLMEAALQQQYKDKVLESESVGEIGPDMGTALGRALGTALGLGVGALVGGKQGAGFAGVPLLKSYDTYAEQDALVGKQRQLQKIEEAKMIKDELEAVRKERATGKKNQFALAKDITMEEMERESKRQELYLKQRLGIGVKGDTNINIGDDKKYLQQIFTEAAENYDAIATVDSLIETANSLPEQSWLNYQITAIDPSTDEGKFKLRLWDLANKLLKATQGARPSDRDLEVYHKITMGNFLSNPKVIKDLLQSTRNSLYQKNNIMTQYKARSINMTPAQAQAFFQAGGLDQMYGEMRARGLYSGFQLPKGAVSYLDNVVQPDGTKKRIYSDGSGNSDASGKSGVPNVVFPASALVGKRPEDYIQKGIAEGRIVEDRPDKIKKINPVGAR